MRSRRCPAYRGLPARRFDRMRAHVCLGAKAARPLTRERHGPLNAFRLSASFSDSMTASKRIGMQAVELAVVLCCRHGESFHSVTSSRVAATAPPQRSPAACGTRYRAY